MEYPQFIGLNFVVYLISLCRTDVLSSKNLKKRFLVCATVITIILSLLTPAVTFHIAADVAEMHRRKRSFRREPSSEARTRRALKRVHRAQLLIWAICASLRRGPLRVASPLLRNLPFELRSTAHFSTYTSTSSGRSPAQIATSEKLPLG